MKRIEVAILLTAALVAAACGGGGGTPSVLRLHPMRPVTADAMREVRNAAIVDDGSGQRRAGIVVLLAKEAFNTGAIRLLDRTAELLEDSPPDSFGKRIITIRAADAGLDRLIAGITADPSVVAASKGFIAHSNQVATP